MIRLVYERGKFGPEATDLVSTALFWFAFSLPFNGLFLLLTRTFFSLQRPWVPTAIGAGNLAITAIGAFALYGPFGVGGIVAATAIATAVSVAAQAYVLRGALGRLELGQLLWTTIRVLAASAALAAASYGVWDALDSVLGRGLGGQIISLGIALAVGAAVYWLGVTLLRIPEAQQIRSLLRRDRAAVGAEPEEPEAFDEPADSEEFDEIEESEGFDQIEESEEFDEVPPPADDGLIRGLVILPGSPRAGEHFLLDREVMTIGRNPEADVFLDDRSVSRSHVELVREDDGGYRAEDLDSRNGTFVNRRRIESMRLEDGDELQIGIYAIGYIEDR
jgi:hypothetical protein